MRKSILPLLIAMSCAFAADHNKIRGFGDVPITKTPTLKDQFGKRKPQGYKKHLRKIGKK